MSADTIEKVEVKFGDVKQLPNETTNPIKGSFSLDNPSFAWFKCREQFAPKFLKETEGFFFSIVSPFGNQLEGIASFIGRTEEILSEAHVLENTKFSKTTRPHALWVVPSMFWRECPVRRSLLTILLRCGQVYDPEKNNYETALKSDPYAVITEMAIRRFLFGYTTSTEKNTNPPGWRDLFQNKTIEDIRKALVLPAKNKVERNLLAFGKIWN